MSAEDTHRSGWASKTPLRPGKLGKVTSDYKDPTLADQRDENEHLMNCIRDFYRSNGQPEPLLWQEEVVSGRTRRMTIRSRIAPGTRV